MVVVAAAVGLAGGLAGKRQAALLLHGQGVDVRPHQQNGAVFLFADQGGEAAAAAGLYLQAHFFQLSPDIGAGLGHFTAGFRVGVQGTAVPQQGLVQFVGSLQVIHGLASCHVGVNLTLPFSSG